MTLPETLASPPPAPSADLCARLQAAATGCVEWCVQHPVDQGICMTFSTRNSSQPEQEARQWLEDHRRRFPDGPYAGHEVVRRVVLDSRDRLLLEAAEAITHLTSRTHP